MSTAALPLPTTIREIERELRLLDDALRARTWGADPIAWAEQRLGDTLWSGQRQILKAVAENRKTAVATCHGVGKSYSAALLATWWIDSHKPGEAYVVTTAPTSDQVRIILWNEIGRAHLRGRLAGRVNQTEWMMMVPSPDGKQEKEESVAIGRKPNDYTPTAFQGKHAPFVLIIVDEGNGVRGPLWAAFDSLMINDASKLLTIGNPDDPTGEFYEATKPGDRKSVV